jgi:hypothetical protein
MGQEREERGVGLPEDDLDGGALATPHLADEPPRATERTDPEGRALRRFIGGDPLGKSGHDLVGPERGAIVELHVRAESKSPDEPVAGDRPRRREGGLDIASLAECDEPLVEKPHRQELGRSGRLRRVKTRGDPRHADVEIARRCRAGEAGKHQQRNERGEERRAPWLPGAPPP